LYAASPDGDRTEQGPVIHFQIRNDLDRHALKIAALTLEQAIPLDRGGSFSQTMSKSLILLNYSAGVSIKAPPLGLHRLIMQFLEFITFSKTFSKRNRANRCIYRQATIASSSSPLAVSSLQQAVSVRSSVPLPFSQSVLFHASSAVSNFD